MKHSTTTRRRTATRVFLVIGALTLVLAGSASAVIPDAQGVFRACVAKTNGLVLGVPHSKGDVRILDTGESCRNYETAVS